MSAAVTMRDVRCEADGTTILRIDELVIETGERVALIGHNGAGKTTLLQLLSGFRRPSRGQIEVLGRRLDAGTRATDLRRLRCDIGQVFQGLHLVTRLTALENVAIGALGRLSGFREVAGSWLRCWSPELVRRANDALAQVGIDALADVRVSQLSGGERQKVAIARMLMQRPRLILADEPTANLDPQTALRFGLLLGRTPGLTTTISVVHNPALIATVATRVIALRTGVVIFDAPATDLDPHAVDRLYR